MMENLSQYTDSDIASSEKKDSAIPTPPSYRDGNDPFDTDYLLNVVLLLRIQNKTVLITAQNYNV
jgi:hypothetical protein